MTTEALLAEATASQTVAFTPEVKVAWVKTHTVLAKTMQDAAATVAA